MKDHQCGPLGSYSILLGVVFKKEGVVGPCLLVLASVPLSCPLPKMCLMPPVTCISSNDPAFAGLFARLNPSSEEDRPSATEVIDDFEGEQETLLPPSPGTEDADDVDDDLDEPEAGADMGTNMDKAGDSAFARLEDAVRNASKGVTEGTDAEYRRFVE